LLLFGQIHVSGNVPPVIHLQVLFQETFQWENRCKHFVNFHHNETLPQKEKLFRSCNF